jgi:hypothetical protein
MSIWKVNSALPAGRGISPKAERSERQVPRLGVIAEEKGDIIFDGLMMSKVNMEIIADKFNFYNASILEGFVLKNARF